MKRNKRKRNPNKTNFDSSSQGFDFGFLPRVMHVGTSSLDLTSHMVKGRVIACAYGFQGVDGYPSPIPSLTFVGEVASEMLAASKCLEYWGCAEDGDAADINIILKNDGGYLVGIQPNYPRMMHRVFKDSALIDIMFSGGTWIKTLDSTNPILFEWKDYLKSKLAPIEIGFATASAVNGAPRVDTITTLEGSLSFVKFGVTIQTEAECPDHWFFDIVNRLNRKRLPRVQAKGSKPAEVAAARTRVIDSAFPVSRTRIRRQKLCEQVEALVDVPITGSQIEQATINVMLSREWTDNCDHYKDIAKLDDEWWKLVGRRVEVAGMPDTIKEINAHAILRQLALDVNFTLRQHGATISPKFQSNQKLFARLGYAQV